MTLYPPARTIPSITEPAANKAGMPISAPKASKVPAPKPEVPQVAGESKLTLTIESIINPPKE